MNILTYQVSKEKRTPQRAQNKSTNMSYAFNSLIHRGTANISCCIYSSNFYFPVITEVNYWEKAVVANIPISTGNLCRVYFKICHHVGVGRSSIFRKQTLHKPLLMFWLCSWKRKIKTNHSICNTDFAFQDNMSHMVSELGHKNLAPACS